MEYNWTNEDIKLAEKFIEIRKRGFYADSKQLTDLYNRVLNKHVNVTSCGSCLSQRCKELEGALNHFKQKMAISSPKDSVPEVEPTVTKEDKNKSIRKKK